MKTLPLGIQSIREVLEEDAVYVDKTSFALDLIKNGKHYFISRPRRFGKSLFLSTLEEIFKGNRELFKGLAIDQTGYDWQEYPVLYFDFARIASEATGEFKISLQEAILKMARSKKLFMKGSSMQILLESLIELLQKTDGLLSWSMNMIARSSTT